MKRIMITGNKNYGLARELAKVFPEADFFSRSSSDTDLNDKDARQEIAQLSLEYDVYISCSCLSQFRQTLLLEQVYGQWVEAGKSGQIICLGSSADKPVKGHRWIYPIEKKALKAYCQNLSTAVLGGHGHKPPGIRVTYISPGYLNTPEANEKHPEVKKIDLRYLTGLIQWVLNQPEGINISEIGLDPIQFEGAVEGVL